MSEVLERLAEGCGIALEYRDIWGAQRRASEGTLRAILAAMGVGAESDDHARNALSRLEQERERRAMAPVLVVRHGERPALHLNLALADAGHLGWRLKLEDGSMHEGTLSPPSLTPTPASTELVLPVAPPLGYHRLSISRGDMVLGETLLIVAPSKCHRPTALDGEGRVWGPAMQLYGLRSARNWGIGDFTDLADLADHWVSRGASLAAVNPLHALFPHNPAHASPYSPSSRLFFNVLYLDVESIEDFRESEQARALVESAQFKEALAKVRGTELVDYVGVAELKARAFKLAYQHFRKAHLPVRDARAADFDAFRAEGGEVLRQHALFEALQEHFFRVDPSIYGWPAWPQAFRDPASPEVERFAAEHGESVEYYQYLQWQAALQLESVSKRVRDRGAQVGLYADLAVSIDRAGAEAWANQRSYAVAASVGAPPDEFNLRGQDWGLPPLMPERLRDAAYAPFIATLRANMRHAGVLRIDHVMGLARLFWVPAGSEAVDGAYVHYPFDDMLGILCLESQRHRCMVVGEDLGTVPDHLREALSRAGIVSTRLLLFERQPSGEFKPPSAYVRQAIVAASTHDLPTLTGWWEGRDLVLRSELRLFPDEAMRDKQFVERAQDRIRLLGALGREKLLPAGVDADAAELPAMTSEVALAVHSYLARTPSRLMLVQLEDVIGVREQANLPATVDSHPNWRRKLPLAVELWLDDRRLDDLSKSLRRERPAVRAATRAASMAATRIPRATYRLQLHRDFGFTKATALVPYLAALGVSHVYCSPYLRARSGSRHGYDIVDHGEINPEIGSSEDFDRFVAELERHGMGQIADVVPNHMGIMGGDNAWWLDVLENGPASAFAEFFDIDWHPLDPDLAGKVLVPVLSDHYGRVLDRGEIKLEYEPDAGAFTFRYYEHKLPVDPKEYPRVLQRALDLHEPSLPAAARSGLFQLAAAFTQLPSRNSEVSADVERRRRDNEPLKQRLARLVRDHPPLNEAIDRAVQTFNVGPGRSEGVADLHSLLEAQAYRVTYWRVASDAINYRRFFDINELAALCMENPAVFEATHRLVLQLAAAGKIEGLRIDHPDGLYDPAEYFERVQLLYAQLTQDNEGSRGRSLYVVIEKIEATHEHLPAGWRIQGTTGYRFASLVGGLFVDTATAGRVDRTWRAFVGEGAAAFDDIAYSSRRMVMRSALQAELNVLANRLLRIARADRNTRDLTLSAIRDALAEITACFPVYRTYVAQRASAQDRRYIDWALGRARRRSRAADSSVFAFIRDVLLLHIPEGAPTGLEQKYRAFAMRFQQFTAPVMAKGVEDTAFYIFNRLVSLNEVGSDPQQFGTTRKAFHRANSERNIRWPHALLALSTHDNKRSADVRARISVISEMPAVWRALLRHWSRLNRRHKRVVNERPAPSRNDEYLLYQTLIGTFPVADQESGNLRTYWERIEQYMVKAAREAKVSTSWVNVDEEYETALAAFVAAILEDSALNVFLADLRANVASFAWFGALNSVATALLQCTAPGVPDIYQGSELIDLHLVDPDNRRPVDYARRRELLDALRALAAAPPEERAQSVRAMLASPWDGRLKLWVISRALDLRRRSEELFATGDYLAISAEGPRSRNVVAYARRHHDSGAIAISGRLFATLGLDARAAPVGADVWRDTRIELPFALPDSLNDMLSGRTIDAGRGELALATVFTGLPYALLTW